MSNESDNTVIGVLLLAIFVGLLLLSHFWLAPTIFSEQRDAGESIAENTMDESAVQDYRWFRQ